MMSPPLNALTNSPNMFEATFTSMENKANAS